MIRLLTRLAHPQDDRYCFLHARIEVAGHALDEEDDKLGWDLPDDGTSFSLRGLSAQISLLSERAWIAGSPQAQTFKFQCTCYLRTKMKMMRVSRRCYRFGVDANTDASERVGPFQPCCLRRPTPRTLTAIRTTYVHYCRLPAHSTRPIHQAQSTRPQSQRRAQVLTAVVECSDSARQWQQQDLARTPPH